jgi:release factor glutamine methyltransferase
MKPPGLLSLTTLREAIAAAAGRLVSVSATSRLDAELLAARALGTSREALLLQGLDQPAPPGFAPLVERRLKGEPVAYIIGVRDFWTISLHVAPGVLIPRPDSETLIEAAVAHFGVAAPRTVLDLGTGSGALLLAALDQWPSAHGVGVDRSPQAVSIARANAERLGLARRARIIEGDWAEDIVEQFDLVLCNPPYIRENEELPLDIAGYEPASALYAGSDGLACYRSLAPETSRLLAPGGLALFEIGADQGDSVGAIFRRAGHQPRLLKDMAGRNRCIAIHCMDTMHP